mgnify:CR=1 FL=1
MKQTTKIQKLTIYFKNYFFKEVEVEIERDQYGDYSIVALKTKNYITCQTSFYSSSRIRTVRRESKILNYVNQFVNIDEKFADDSAGF